MNVSECRMEETGPHIAGGFDYSRNPRSIAARRNILSQSKMSAKMLHDAPQFLRTLHNKSAIEIRSVIFDQPFDLHFQCIDFLRVKCNSSCAIGQPAIWTVECAGGQICGQK